MSEEIRYGAGGPSGERYVPPGEGYVPPVVPEASAARLIKRISWGAVFGGVMVALGMEILFALFGLFIGFAIYTPDSPHWIAIKDWSIAWYLITSFCSLFAGGWAAARLSGNPNTAGMHGMVTWGLATLATWAAIITASWHVVGSSMDLFRTAAFAVPGAASAIEQQAANASNPVPGYQLGSFAHQLWVFWIVAFGGVVLALFASIIGGRAGMVRRPVA